MAATTGMHNQTAINWIQLPPWRHSLSVYVWAVNSDNAQIRWNHLSGYSENGNATAVAALTGANGDTVGVAGTINMDGVEYASAYAGMTVNGTSVATHGQRFCRQDR